MIKISNKENFKIIYLDQFASSGIFESNIKEWIRIKDLIKDGYAKRRLICPLSSEHFLETSQKLKDKALFLDSEFYKISGGYSFKSELFITSQLMISLIRKNNITLKTFLYDKVSENILSCEENLKSFDTIKKSFDTKIEEGALVANEIRKSTRKDNLDSHTKNTFMTIHKSILVSEFINRLNDLLRDKRIIIRGVPFNSGDVPHWIDQIIFQLTNTHRITKKEIELLIKELKHGGFNNIPTLNIRTSLSSINAVCHKKENPNDHIDFARISSGLPISNILLTDAKRKNEIKELSLDKEYDVKVFSGIKDDLDGLIVELEKIV